jgi:hypothetical protein
VNPTPDSLVCRPLRRTLVLQERKSKVKVKSQKLKKQLLLTTTPSVKALPTYLRSVLLGSADVIAAVQVSDTTGDAMKNKCRRPKNKSKH